ncbi:MAG TPA: glycosyltransferase family 2 protein [Pelobium sp.]|nr:glycosyltransferase family 2 protein [Pelobium sp.]
MLFSFVIPTYNRSSKVIRAIDSIINQPGWANSSEIIVVNDGSTDDTEDKLQPYLDKKQICLIRHVTNQGVATAKNTGILNAKNKYVVLLDSDDLLAKSGLNHLKNLILQNDYDLVFCGTRVLNSNRLMYDVDFKGVKTYHELLKTAVGEYLPIAKTSVIQKNLLHNLRGYESITWLGLAKQGYQVYFDNEPIRLYDDGGEDRLSYRFNGLKNAVKMRDGYAFYLKEFGIDLKSLNFSAYFKLNVKLLCYFIMSLRPFRFK